MSRYLSSFMGSCLLTTAIMIDRGKLTHRLVQGNAVAAVLVDP